MTGADNDDGKCLLLILYFEVNLQFDESNGNLTTTTS